MTDNQKQPLRHEALKHRERIHNFNNEDPDLACDIFFDAIRPSIEQVISYYWPIQKEFDPSGIIEKFTKLGGVSTLPVIDKSSRILKFAKWSDGDPLIAGPFDTLQPEDNENTKWAEPDIILVPLLAFDRKGHRLGYGGGFYDATISSLRAKKNILAVGVGYAQQAVIFNLPTDQHDQKLDWVVTPQEALYFGN